MNANLFMAVGIALILIKPLVGDGKIKFPGWHGKASAAVAVGLLIAPVIALLRWAGGLVGL